MADQPTKLQVVSVVGFYMGAALVMVFVNKAVLNSTPDLPFSFLCLQTSIAVILLRLAASLSPKRFGRERLTTREIKQLTPLVGVGVIGLVFNTLCLRDVDTTFFQIARGLLLPMTIVVSSFATRKFPRRPVLVAAGIVTIGFFIGVRPSASFSSDPFSNAISVGLIYGVLSSLLTAVHAVIGKQVSRQRNVVQLSHNGNLMSTCALLPCIVYNGELAILNDMFFKREGDQWKVFLVGGAITGVFGLFLSLSGILSIKVTSPVTHMFSGAARSVLQTALGAAIFGDVVSSDRVASISVIMAGTLYFTWVQNAQSQQVPPQRPLVEKLPSYRNEKD